MTHLKYLEDSYLFEDKSTLLEVQEDERGVYALFESTIFYPQGGGQASDSGKVLINDKEFTIDFVKKVENQIRHYGDFSKELKDTKATLFVDREKRIQHMKSHTAGHLIGALIEKEFGFKAIKGYHFLEGPYIEFVGQKPDNTDSFIQKVNNLLKEELNKKLSISIKNIPLSLIENKNLADSLAKEDIIRVMQIKNYKAIPCGGTHLKNLSELLDVTISKVKRKKDHFRVSYSFQ